MQACSLIYNDTRGIFEGVSLDSKNFGGGLEMRLDVTVSVAISNYFFDYFSQSNHVCN